MNPFRTLSKFLASTPTSRRKAVRFTPSVELLEDRLTPTVHTWTGAAGLFWTDPGNWNTNQKPNSGDDLVFPENALNKTNANDFINGKNFHSIRFTGDGGYTLTGNRIELNKEGTAISSSFGTNYINLPVDFDFGAEFDPRRYDIRVGTNGTLVINGVISGGLGEVLQKFGDGNLILNAANTYTMQTLVFEGTLTIQNGAALGSAQDNHATEVRAGTLVLTNNITVPEDILVINNSGGIRNASGNNTITGTIRLHPADDFAGPSRLRVDTGSKLTLTDLRDDGSIEGGFDKLGGGELVLPNANTNSEDSVIADGRVTIQNNNALGTTDGDTTVLGDASLAFVGTRVIAEELNIGHGFAFPELIALNNSDVTLTGEVHVNETARFKTIASGKLKLTQELVLNDRLDIVGGPIEFAGGMRVAGLTFLSLSGGDTLNVSGGLHGTQTLQLNFTSGTGGTLLLAGPAVNTHTGFVRVNNSAALEVNNTLSSPIQVAGGTLRGSGTLNTVAAFDGGTIDPGSQRLGRLTIANGLSMSSATLHIDLLNGDQVRVLGGNVDLLNPILDVTQALFGTAPPDSLRIIDNLGPNPVNGTFAGLGEGATFTVNTGSGTANFTITYQGGTGNDVVITRNTGTMAPGIAITPSIQEGQVAHLTGHLVDPDRGDRLTLVVNWGDGSKPQTFHPGLNDFNIEHRYRDNGQYVVQTSWFDDHGGGNHRDLTVNVTNVPPVLTDIDVRIVGNNQVFVSGRIVDPGRDSFTLVINWGDGHSSTHRFAAGTERFQVSHRYQSKGDYRVRLTLTDDDGGADRDSLRVRLGERNAWLAALADFLDDLPRNRRDDLPWQWI